MPDLSKLPIPLDSNFIIFYIIAGLAILGVGFVFWLMSNEKKTDEIFAQMEQETQTDTPDRPMNMSSMPREQLLNQLGIASPKSQELTEVQIPNTATESKPKKNLLGGFKFPSFGKKKELIEDPVAYNPFKDLQEEPLPEPPVPTAGTSSLKLTPEKNEKIAKLNEADQKLVEQDVQLSLDHNELKEKYAKLDKLFTEKSTELEKTQKILELEMKNRKEFNKVKDILEKEIKDTKDLMHQAKVDTTNAQAEADRQKKRIEQLEEKISGLEKENLNKENKIDELVKRLQTFASPATAHVPPVPEPKIAAPEPTPEPEPAAPAAAIITDPELTPTAIETVAAPAEIPAAEPPPREDEEQTEESADTGGLKLQPDILTNPENPQPPETSKPE